MDPIYIKNPQILVDDENFYIKNETTDILWVVTMCRMLLGKDRNTSAIKVANEDVYQTNPYGYNSSIDTFYIHPGQTRYVNSPDFRDRVVVVKHMQTNKIEVVDIKYKTTLVMK